MTIECERQSQPMSGRARSAAWFVALIVAAGVSVTLRVGVVPAAEAGTGVIAFFALAQGQLTDRYLNGLAADSRLG